VDVSAGVGDLEPSTVYHYRLVATNADGTTTGEDGTFTTATVQHTLTVAKSGSGAGSVTSSPAGIDCGATCDHGFDEGTQVTLTATRAKGSKFKGWGGGCSGTGACAVTLSADQNVTATFARSPANTKITKAMINSKKRRATFKFKAHGTATGFQCELKRKHKRAKFKRCRSPKTYRHLKPARYKFAVRTVGPGGHDPTPAKKKFRIK
jgi:hypothetical protein